MGFKTPEEAIEAWNTWRGRYIPPSPKLFRECNPCNECANIIDGDKYNEPKEDELVSTSSILPNGAFTSPWPKLSPKQKLALESDEFEGITIRDIFALRARWCALFPSVIEYRDEISDILKRNDRENQLLNDHLNAWNTRLKELGLPLFKENDLRGINIGGLELEGEPYEGVWLRNIDMKFSDFSLVQLDGVNLYGSDLRASVGIRSSFINSILCLTNFGHSFLSHSRFELSDLNSAIFDNALCYKAQFDGAILDNVSVCGAMFKNTTFKPVEFDDKGISKLKTTSLRDLKWDEKSEFDESDLLENGSLVDESLLTHLLDDNSKNKGIALRIYESIQLKPSMFGVGIDIKELFKRKS
ncbi:MAG: pentapeptide repeat-containing protein [Neptuniibacter sp.]